MTATNEQRAPRGRRAAVAGAVVVAAYVALALWSGSLSPLARRPLLDGVHGAAPYNWVQPPPPLAPTNRAPMPASESVAIGPNGVGQTTVNTGDGQVSLLLDEGSVPKADGKTKVEIKVDPLDPQLYAPPPDDLTIRGNVYRIVVRYAPGGTPVSTLAKPGTLTMVYPAPGSELLGVKHRMLYSKDGKAWRVLAGTSDQHGTQQVWTQFENIGYYAIAAPDVAAAGGGFPVWIPIVGLSTLAIGSGVWLQVSRRREESRRRKQAQEALIRRSRSTKRRR